MPGNPHAAVGVGETASESETGSAAKGRGRTRYCKKCKFTCTDAREFTAHQTSHSESGDIISDSDLSQQSNANSNNNNNNNNNNSSDNNNLLSKRTLRPKRTSKGSISDSATSTTTMEPRDSGELSSPVEETKGTVEALCKPELVSSEAKPEETSVNDRKCMNNNEIDKQKGDFVDATEEEEEGDEPDAMTIKPQAEIGHVHSGHSEGNKLPNGVIDNLSGEEDMDDEDRLVIDDGSLSKQTSKQNHEYSCPECDMTTTNPKIYLEHHSQEHNTDANIYECNECDFTTTHKQNLSKHRQQHFSNENGHTRPHELVNEKDNGMPSPINERNNFLNIPSSNSSKPNSLILDDDLEEDMEVAEASTSASVPLTITAENIDQVLDEDKKKKKKTRQEVDPGKYFEAVDSSGTKYACSQCGNIYKWRKSLNKHWKEKHSLDPLVEVASPPGMLELLKSGKYTQLGARRIYDNAFLLTIKTNKNEDPPHPSPSPRNIAQTPSPPNFLNTSQSLAASASRIVSSVATMMPKMIGPFVANTAQPVFPGMPMALHPLSLPNGYDSPEENALDLTRDFKPDSRNSPYSVASGQDQDQDQPLDFSKKNNDKLLTDIKVERWDDVAGMKQAHSMNQLIPKVHRCSKCDYTSSSEIDFANHMSSHLGKRLVKCNECKLQISSMDELNTHFIKNHGRKLTEYKEAIKKIPHGLQQTYHLLKMDLNDISELGNQDLGATEGKSLKCKKCDFEAKWPAELQKHAVSHSEERPYICMVCGSTYKWKWDLVKHFQKSHPNLPNPYRRNDKRDTPDGSSEEDADDEPEAKRSRLDLINGGSLYNRDDSISVEGIIAATQAGQRLISSQPNILDDEPSMERNMAFLQGLPFAMNGEATSAQVAQMAQAAHAAQEILDRRNKAQKALQDAVRNRQSGGECSSIGKKNGNRDSSASPTSSGSKEVLPYKCPMCNYHARWPSEVTQHMKNHSDSKPYLCPRCDYRSKWKWDVVKHLKRCGGGGINDVIDTTKMKKKDMSVSNGPPNAVVSQQGRVQKMTPQPSVSYAVPTLDDSGPSSLLMRMGASRTPTISSGDDLSRPGSGASNTDFNSASNNNDLNAHDNNTNNNYRAYTDGLTMANMQSFTPVEDSSNATNPTPSPAPHTTSSRQNSSGEIWKCPHCMFRTQSQAELKRHTNVHSDDKPFKCDVCQYSTRWACDLKKHRKSYNHPPNPEGADAKKSNEEVSKGRFKCQQCSIYFQTFQSLIDHRFTVHIGQDSSQSSPAPQTDQNEIDAARIKHPRKPIKQIQCMKCPFVCKSRQTMDKHLEEHELLEMSGIHCFYCSSQFKDKESLLDHITIHSSFNPKEWETFFMISEEEQQQQASKDNEAQINASTDGMFQASDGNRAESAHVNAEPQQADSKRDKDSNDSTDARIQQILSEVPKQTPVSQHSSKQNKFKCEWCSAEFVNLTAVYKHASQAHPIQLKEQDVSMTASGGGSVSPKSPNGQQIPLKKQYTGEPIDILRQQIAEKRNQNVSDKVGDMFANNTKIREAMDLKNESLDNKHFKCDKCSFSSANFATYQRHCELHGSNLPSQCWFCDYRVARMDLLYQHMKISHTRKWKAFSQDPKYAEQIHKMNLAFSNSSAYGNNNDSPPEHFPDAMDLSSKSKPTEVTHDIMYITKQQYTWSGIPVNVIPMGNALNFVCPHCEFHDASIAKTCAHVMQSHRAMSKFTCKKCDFYDDNIHVMSDHCKNCHPEHERIVEVLDFKQLNFSELQMVQLSAMRDRMPQDLSKLVAQSVEEKLEKAAKAMSCPFCPFKTLVTEHMKSHLSDHSRQARYRCQMCDFSSDSKSVITDHVKVHDDDYTLDSKSMPQSNSQVRVKKEPSNKTSNESEMKAAGRNQGISESETGHTIQQSSPKSRLNKRIRYRCTACPFQNLCRTNIMKHRKQHNNNKKYQCPKCTYGAARAVLLKKHLDSHNYPVEDDGQYHDIKIDPNGPDPEDIFKTDENDEQDSEITEVDQDDFDEDDANSDLDEIDAKAIADLEAKDILEAEAAHKATIILDDDLSGDSTDKPLRKQKCPHCPFSSNSSYEFRKHLNFHGTQERYKCDRCSYSLDRPNLLNQHRKLHADEPGFDPNPPASSLLNTSFIIQQNHIEKAEAELEDAGESTGQEAEKGDTQFPCTSCPYKSAEKKSLDIHCNSHGLRKRFICDQCDWSADRSGLLYQHRKVHASNPAFVPNRDEKVFLNLEFDDGASGEFEAKFMEIKNSDKSMKEGDAETSTSPPFKLTVVKKSYPCKLCPYKTNSKSSFSFHKSMHNSGAEFTCPKCTYSAGTAGLLQQHLQLHNPATAEMLSPISSGVMSPEFGQQMSEPEDTYSKNEPLPLTNKSNESQKHTTHSEGPSNHEFKCQRCPFTAFTQTLLKEHVKGHTSQESLACPYCDFTAMSKDIMFPHIQIHFPGTKLEPEALDDLLEKNTKNHKDSTSATNYDGGTITYKKDKPPQQPEKETVKTRRVYVCQYCEREFEAKDLMIQHEKQHLVGSH